MKFAFILFTWFPYGGLTRDLSAIARACQRRGHEVRIYAGEIRGKVDADLEVRGLAEEARGNYAKNQTLVARLPTAYADFAPQLRVGFNRMPNLDAYYAADACFAEHAARGGWWRRLTPRYRQFLEFENAVFGRDSNTQILMLAKKQIPIYQHFYATPDSRITLLPPGISRKCIADQNAVARRHAFRARFGFAENEKLLLALGSGFRTKGVDRTLRVLAQLPQNLNLKLIVVGADATTKWQKRARRLGVAARVWFAGAQDAPQDFLLGADLLVHPARRENTGTVLLEALVAGLPAIATDVCGYADYIATQQMGEVLGAPFDAAQYLHAIQKVLAQPRQIWQQRGREFAAHADIYDLPSRACARLEQIADAKR